MGPYLLDGRLHEMTVPVTLVWGNADQLLTLDYARRVIDGLTAGARLIEVEGCGHVPMRECPQAFNQAFAEALANVPAAAEQRGAGQAAEAGP
jgi:pimeloyl-ACP methyl ester carboxylesterase